MDEHDLRQRDMLEAFGTRSVISEALAGKRAITKKQAVDLGKRFKVDPAVFIELPAESPGPASSKR
ncbi:MAG TPA: hypothetical protein VEZ90_05000 [Blastocatellia bacterium]|nr:hypothetical protein [Blastocatellia bacterium]